MQLTVAKISSTIWWGHRIYNCQFCLQAVVAKTILFQLFNKHCHSLNFSKASNVVGSCSILSFWICFYLVWVVGLFRGIIHLWSLQGQSIATMALLNNSFRLHCAATMPLNTLLGPPFTIVPPSIWNDLLLPHLSSNLSQPLSIEP